METAFINPINKNVNSLDILGSPVSMKAKIEYKKISLGKTKLIFGLRARHQKSKG